jgi:predicted kinase
MAFVEQPIPDQEIADDALVDMLADQLLDRLKSGERLYVHCRGGHGRTGTVCAILLGRLYSLSAKEAVARTQLYHDTRKIPVFCADGYQQSADGSSCVMLFPIQREQVFRLLAPAEAPSLARALSSKYGHGASNYDEKTMEGWQSAALAAAQALNAGRRPSGNAAAGSTSCGSSSASCGSRESLRAAVGLFQEALQLRPDFMRCYIGQSQALRQLGDLQEAKEVLERGLQYEPKDAALLKELRLVESASLGQGSQDAAADEGEGERPSTTEEVSPPLTWRPKVSQPTLVMLVGLPGSGKSTFAQQLVASGGGWTRACQDELSGRDAFESEVGRVAKDSNNRLILDRTNMKRSDRKAFLDLAFKPKRAVCVFFNHSLAECSERVAKRTDHPTIRYGGGQNAVRSMLKDLEAPTKDEGFEEVLALQNFREAEHLLRCWGAEPPEIKPMGFFKFPTTPHVLDLTHGRALQESDRLLSPAEAEEFFNGKNVLIVEEKIDGANLGISLSENWEPRFQNRAKYVTSKYATQWKGLDAWWEEHSWEISQLLEPEVEILFGEWTWQRHSVQYTCLPAYFIAFDIYNKRAGRFVSARERDRRLAAIGGGIPVVPRLTERKFNSRAELEALLSLQSAYGEVVLEGIYLRMDEPEEVGGGLWLRQRGKIVRADFIQGIEDDGHFINKEVVRNKLAY